jgi:hypothetical protein
VGVDSQPNALTSICTDGNQEGVGAALARQSLSREDFFVTSKIPGGLNASATTAALDQALQQLKLRYVDLMLLHWPGIGAKSRQEQWLALEAWAKQGKARAIGISHYCRHHLDDILSVATLPVALNQVQYHVGMVSRAQKTSRRTFALPVTIIWCNIRCAGHREAWRAARQGVHEVQRCCLHGIFLALWALPEWWQYGVNQ